MFDKILERYTVDTDAIRDFVNSLGATVEEERAKENQTFSDTFIPFFTARAIVERNVDELKVPEELRNVLKALNEVLSQTRWVNSGRVNE